MFVQVDTNNKVETIMSWLSSYKKQETQTGLARRFGQRWTCVSLSFNNLQVLVKCQRLRDWMK